MVSRALYKYQSLDSLSLYQHTQNIQHNNGKVWSPPAWWQRVPVPTLSVDPWPWARPQQIKICAHQFAVWSKAIVNVHFKMWKRFKHKGYSLFTSTHQDTILNVSWMRPSSMKTSVSLTADKKNAANACSEIPRIRLTDVKSDGGSCLIAFVQNIQKYWRMFGVVPPVQWASHPATAREVVWLYEASGQNQSPWCALIQARQSLRHGCNQTICVLFYLLMQLLNRGGTGSCMRRSGRHSADPVALQPDSIYLIITSILPAIHLLTPLVLPEGKKTPIKSHF